MNRLRPLLIPVALLAACVALVTIASRGGTSYSAVQYSGTPPCAAAAADYGKDRVTEGIPPLNPAIVVAAARDEAALHQTPLIAAGTGDGSSRHTPEPQPEAASGDAMGPGNQTEPDSPGEAFEPSLRAGSSHASDPMMIALPLLIVAGATLALYVLSRPRGD